MHSSSQIFKVLSAASRTLSCHQNQKLGCLPALWFLYGGRSYPVAKHSLTGSLSGSPGVRAHLTPATCCLQEGITTFSHWLTGLAFGNPTLLQQLLEQPLDAPGQAAPVQAVPDAHLYATLLVRPMRHGWFGP